MSTAVFKDEESVALVERARELIKVSGTEVVIEDDFYEKMLPSDISMETVSRIQTHNSRLLSTTGLIIGELGIKVMEENKDVSEVTARFKAGKDTHKHTVRRFKTVPNPKDPGVTSTVYGALQSSVKVCGTNGSAGELKRVRKHLNELALSALS